ncbi:hypothetical protein RU87_GL000522 [Lactococcus plantarum]|uniref:Lysozyme n=2 Tax=Pseudolactococcus plantarum TaxID=1365 RepID=A0A2A5RWJ8_9LACT|nr:lysozyme [Lactococcus plantarum]PCS05605.1 hypothetical protein RU87_GL000522 [Lactococcus plantarum]
MKVGTKGLNLIKEYEGCRLTAYDIGDGMITIGWGHAESKSSTSLVAGVTTWSQAKADAQLISDLVSYENAVSGFFTRSFNQSQFDALVSFAYNLGGGVFDKYGWSRTASDSWICSQMILYVNKGTQFEAGLTRRRKAEIALYQSTASDNDNKNKEGDLEMFIAKCTGGNVNQYIKNGSFVLFNLNRGTYSILNGQSQVDAVTEGYQLSTAKSLTKGSMSYLVITNLIMGAKLDYRG